MRTFKCRDVDNDGDQHEVTAYDAENASEEFVRMRWADLDYLTKCLVEVQADDGSTERFDVYVESQPVFRAHRRPPTNQESTNR